MQNNNFSLFKYFLFLFWSVSIILPLLNMMSAIVHADIVSTISSSRFIKALFNSINVSITSTIISVLLAFILSFCVARSNIKHKNIVNTLLTVPMLLPSISHGMGLILILGTNGWISNLIGLNGIGIYGFWGIVAGSVMYSFPVAYLMLYDILKYENYIVYEVAEVLGISFRDKLLSITLPYLKKPLLSILFATFTLVITDYGVPLMIGGKYITLPVMMYQDVIGMLDFSKGAIIGLVLLVPAFIACILDIVQREKCNTSFYTKKFLIKINRTRDNFASLIIIIFLILLLLPICSFSFLAFIKRFPIDFSFSLDNIMYTINRGGIQYLINSIVISFGVSVIGIVFAFISAYITTRAYSVICFSIHFFSIIPLAIPGLVLGLSYAYFFSDSFIYGTLAILILANTVHFFSSPYLMAHNTLKKINRNLENVGETLGINKYFIIKDVIIPQTKESLFEMFCYFFVNSMMTISAVSFLANYSNKPLSLMIVQFEAQMKLESAALVSLAILFINIIMKAFFYYYRKKVNY